MPPPDLPTVEDFDWDELLGPSRPGQSAGQAPPPVPPLPPPPRVPMPSSQRVVPVPPRDRPSSLVAASAKWKARQSEAPGRFNLASDLLDAQDLALLDRVAQPPAPLAQEEAHVELEGTILVVDPDGQARRYLEVAVSAQHQAHLKVVTAMDASSALHVLSSQPVHLVVSEADLPDGSGMVLYSQLTQERRLDGIPFVILTADDSPESKLLALRAGVHDYLVKPCDQAELGARCVALLNRARSHQAQLRRRSYMLAGDFSALPFPDLMVMLELSRVTGTLSIMTRHGNATLLLSEGRALHATYGTIVGDEAAYRLMADGSGRFEFAPGKVDLPDEAITITQSITGLVMEGARRLDEGEMSSQGKSQALPDDAPAGGFTPIQAHGLSRAEAQLFADELAVLPKGDLRFLDSRSLGAFLGASNPSPRAIAFLIADPVSGMEVLLDACAAPTAQVLAAALVGEPKVACASFGLSLGYTLDVVLLDARAASAFLPSLLSAPEIVVIAPPSGDLLSLGTTAQNDVDSLLTHLAPRGIVAVGNDRLIKLLCDLPSLRESAVHMVALPTSTHALREILQAGAPFLAADD